MHAVELFLKVSITLNPEILCPEKPVLINSLLPNVFKILKYSLIIHRDTLQGGAEVTAHTQPLHESSNPFQNCIILLYIPSIVWFFGVSLDMYIVSLPS